MTFLISKFQVFEFQVSKFQVLKLINKCLLSIALMLLCTTSAFAQQSGSVSESVAQQAQLSLEQQLAGLKRLEAMQPDSVGPKYQQGMLLLSYVVMHPQDSKAQSYLEETQRIVGKIEALNPTKNTDRSDLATLQGFYFTALIVTNPQQNGPRYYRDALDSFSKALQLNPNNETARQLQAKFNEGMNAAK